MKISVSFLIPILLVFMLSLLTGCESKHTQLKSSSPDGKAEIIITGKKEGMDPWHLEIEQKKDGKSSKNETQMYASELNNENVIFTWTSNTECVIKLIEQDGASREMSFTF